MKPIRYTLVTDGSSDRSLLPILNWSLRQTGNVSVVSAKWADITRAGGFKNLAERIQFAVEYYPCDLLFVHRDAEKQEPQLRYNEIEVAMKQVVGKQACLLSLCVVPIRMQEAWLLFDEPAIRAASGNPNGIMPLNLPALNKMEYLPDPKAILYEALRAASGRQKRRLKTFSEHEAAIRVPDHICDFSPLRALTAFQRFERDLRALCAAHWHNS